MGPDCNVYGYLYLAKSSSKRTTRGVSRARVIAVPTPTTGDRGASRDRLGQSVRIVDRACFEAQTARGTAAVTDDRGAFCVDVPDASDMRVELYAELVEVPGSGKSATALGEPVYLALGQHVPFRVADRCHLMALVPAQIWRTMRRRIG